MRSDQGRISIQPTSSRGRRHRSRSSARSWQTNGVQVLGTDRDRRSRRDCVDRSRRDRPPRPRRRRAARRLPRRGGRPHRRPHPRAARRGMDSGSTSSPTTAGCCSRAAWRRWSFRRRRPSSRRGDAPGSRTAPQSTSPTVPWFWDPDVRIALAPGATCFEANKEYEHGGVSPQECIVPRLTVTCWSTGGRRRRPRVHEGEVARAAVPGRVQRSDREGRPSTCAGCRRSRSRASLSRRRRRRARARCRCSCQTKNTRASAPTSCSSRSTARSLPSVRSWSGGTGDRRSTSSTGSPPTSSRATSYARTSPSSSAASTRSRRTSASSCSAGTAPRPIPTRSPRALRSSSGR